MTHTHPNIPKYPPQNVTGLPTEPSTGEITISEERFEVQVPTGTGEPPVKKIKEEPSALMSYSEWEKEGMEERSRKR